MTNYNIKIYGARLYWAQVQRIIQGFIGIGCTSLNQKKWDFVYANNFNYSDKDALYMDSPIENNCFKIFNVLDIPPHCDDFPIQELIKQLKLADAITCISEPVKEQIKQIGFNSTVIWNPIKDVFFDESIKREINCLYVGRASDPNKRTYLLSDFEQECISVGPFHNFGVNLGLVSDIQLNNLYNSAKIVPLPSKFEGLGLPALEAMVCGCIPLVCADNPNSYLCPDFCICEPNQNSINKKYKDLLNNFKKYQEIILSEYSNQIAFKFNKYSIANNIIQVFEQAS